MREIYSRSLAIIAVLSLAAFASAGGPELSGTFLGNGEDAKLAFVYAKKGDPFDGKETIEVTLSEKDSGGDSFKANFGEFGSALVLTFTTDGQLIGCQVVHSAHEKQGFSSLGSLKTDAFKLEDGVVSAKVATEEEQEFFGDTWTADLTFKAPVE